MTLHYDWVDVECDDGNARIRMERSGPSQWMAAGVAPGDEGGWTAVAVDAHAPSRSYTAFGSTYYEAIDNLLRLIGRVRSTSATP